MIDLQVVASGSLEEDFAKFSDHAPKLVDKTLRIVAYRYRKHLLTDYMSGGMIGSRTGTLKKSVVVGRKRGARFVYLVGSKAVKNKADGTYNASAIKLANIYEHSGGYTIRPKNKKALVFTGSDGSLVFIRGEIQGRERPFMSTSVRSFPWTAKFAQSEEEVMGKELKRLAAQGKYIPGGLD
jgi:hypothetical protein